MPSPATASPADALAALRAQRVAAARVAPNAFVELVLRDEASGVHVQQAPFHRTWHELIDANARLVIMAHIEAAKTSQISVARVLWELGRDPTLRVAIVSNTHGQASKVLRTIASYIENNAELRAVFPDLRPASPWTDSAITVERATISKDASVQAFGVHGAIVGSRIDLLVIDDATDFENSRTEEQRKQLVAWVDSAVLGRLTARGRCVVVGTAYHPEDLLHVLAARGWPCHRFPVEDDGGLPRWPERWPRERIEAKRLELGPAEAARQLDVMARSDQESRFKAEWIDTALARGAKWTPLSRSDRGDPFLLNVRPPARVVVGIDPSVGASKASGDLCAMAVVLVHGDKTRELLALEAGRWSGPEIIDRTISLHRRFLASRIAIESVAAQMFLVQWLKKLGEAPVVPFTTGKGARSLEWRVEQVAAEFSRHMWMVPSLGGKVRDREAGLLLRDLLYYRPTEHTPDRVAALCFAQWAAEQGEKRAEVGRLDLMSR